MFKVLKDLLPRPVGYDDCARIHELMARRAVLDGSIYDALLYQFDDERNGAGEYVKLRQRAPCIRYNLSRVVVMDAAALLFGEGMFPIVQHPDAGAKEALRKVVVDSGLPLLMAEAAIRGSVGSVAVLLRVLRGRVFWTVMDTDYLTPIYDPMEPDTLLRVREKYKAKGRELASAGYAVAPDDMGVDFWFQRVWDADSETWYTPWRVAETDTVPRVDAERTVVHALGFCPMVWVRNLPGGDGFDGACTFRSAIETQITIEYQLSQADRGLKYSSDPTLLLKTDGLTGGEVQKGGDNALVVPESGDARLLEISGNAANAVVEFCKSLRQMALESIGGSRAEADKVTAPQSGRAQELMYQPLIWLADKLRGSYGQAGLLEMMRMVARASAVYPLRTRDEDIGRIPAGALSLVWRDWFPSTPADKQVIAQALQVLGMAGILSRETSTSIVAPIFDIEDPVAEAALVQANRAADDARVLAQAAQTQAKETLEG